MRTLRYGKYAHSPHGFIFRVILRESVNFGAFLAVAFKPQCEILPTSQKPA